MIENHAQRVPARHFVGAACLFFCTGALGLGYELVWMRKAALIVGASPIALATVLTSFFLGLGIGSRIVSTWFRSRRFSPLFIYGFFEIGIGIFAVAFPYLYELVEAIYATAYPLVSGSSIALLFVRFALLFALFLPPTLLMGGTLPLLLDGLIAEDRSIASRTSALYALNIMGAVLGVLCTCYFAIPTWGMNGTSFVFGAANGMLGLIALSLFRRTAPLHLEASKERVPRWFLGFAFTCGLVAIGLQVCWSRYFTLLHVTTIYSTAMLLAIYLLGLSLGSFLLGGLARRGVRPLLVLMIVQLLLPIALWGLLDAWKSFDLVQRISATLENQRIASNPTLAIEPSWAFWTEEVDTVFIAPLLMVAAVVLLPAILIGIAVPALIASAATTSAALRNSSGRILFWNTLGSSAGAFGAGYVLLPLLGLHLSLTLLGAAALVLAFCAWRRLSASSTPTPSFALRASCVVLAAISLAALVGSAAWRENVTHHAVKYDGIGKGLGYGPNAQRLGITPPELVEVVEGPIDTCFVFENERTIQLCSGCVSLASVGKQGISGQAIQGHLPALFFPGTALPQRCLGICLGSGQSFGALLLYPIRSLDIVDISPSVLDLSLRIFAGFNHGLESDDRVRFHLDDGRHFVQRAPDETYDIVSMEPPPPEADGIHSLYSVEFYREVRRALTKQGVLMQWLPIYRLTPGDATSIVKTLAEVFPETFIMYKGNQDLMTLSYKQRPQFSRTALQERCAIFRQERHIEGSRFGKECMYPMASPEGLLSCFLSAPDDIRTMHAPSIYVDDTQILGYGSGDRYLLHRYRGNQLGQITFAALPHSSLATVMSYWDPPLPPALLEDAERERAAAMHVFRFPDPTILREYRDATLSKGSAEPAKRLIATLLAAAQYDRCARKDRAFDLVLEALSCDPTFDEPWAHELVRDIVVNRFAAFVPLVSQRVAELRARFGDAPLLVTIENAFQEHMAPEEARRARYWGY